MRCFVFTTALLLLCAGCSGESSDARPGSGGSGGSGGSAGSAGAAGAAGDAGCDPNATPEAGKVCVTSVKGRVVDERGAPVPMLLTSVCGSVCYYADSDASGNFEVPLGAEIAPADYSMLAHGRPTRTNFYRRLPASAAGPFVDLGDVRLLDLPASGPELVVRTDNAGTPAQTVTSGDLTLDVPDGVQVRLDVEDVSLGAQGKQFRTRAVPASLLNEFAEPALGLSALYALTPFEASFTDDQKQPAKVRLSFANSAALPADSAVEILALGSYLFPTWIEPATFQVVATGTVSADGTVIQLDPGAGVEYLTWVGIRPKP